MIKSSLFCLSLSQRESIPLFCLQTRFFFASIIFFFVLILVSFGSVRLVPLYVLGEILGCNTGTGSPQRLFEVLVGNRWHIIDIDIHGLGTELADGTHSRIGAQGFQIGPAESLGVPSQRIDVFLREHVVVRLEQDLEQDPAIRLYGKRNVQALGKASTGRLIKLLGPIRRSNDQDPSLSAGSGPV